MRAGTLSPGTLPRPGPIGRLVRLAVGAACLHAVHQLFLFRERIVESPVSVLPNIAVMVLVAALVVGRVVAIGFGRPWGRWPGYLSVAGLLTLATAARLLLGTADHPVLGAVLWTWLVYVFAHLGASFLLAAILGTPGCEMRAIPALLGRITGRPADEHRCPWALLDRIDGWEERRR